MTSTCAAIGVHLGGYVDGELDPRRRVLVARHLADCESCAAEHRILRELGDLLRGAAEQSTHEVGLEGLAAGVISRSRAEQAQSWRALVDHAVEDWRWTLVGAGSVAAAAVTVLLVAGIFALGPRQEPDESLAVALHHLRMPADKFFIIATPAGSDQLPQLLQLEDTQGDASSEAAAGAAPEALATPTDSDLAFALSLAVVGPDGRMNDLRAMSQAGREHTEALLDEIQRRSSAPPVSWSSRRATLQKLGFVTRTNVSGKAL